MAPWLLIQPPSFADEIRVKQVDKGDPQRDQRYPYGFSQKAMAQERRRGAAGHEHGQHAEMNAHPSQMTASFLRMPQGFTEENAYLPDMVRTEGGRHGNAFRLAEGVVLHGTDEIDQYLGDLHRRAFRKKTEKNDQQHDPFDLDAIEIRNDDAGDGNVKNKATDGMKSAFLQNSSAAQEPPEPDEEDKGRNLWKAFTHF